MRTEDYAGAYTSEPSWSDEGDPAAERTQPASKLRLWTLGELGRQPVASWLVEDLVPESAGTPKLITLTGESTTGKSFAALDLAVCVAEGQGFHGKRVKRGGVLYLAAEADGLTVRTLALSQASGLSLDRLDELPLTLIQAALVLSSEPDRDGTVRPTLDAARLMEAIRDCRAKAQALGLELVLVMVDTMRATMRGSENNDDVVAGYLQTVRSVLEQEAPNATGLILHHTGWQDGDQAKKRERGSSVIRGNPDGSLFLETVGERQGRDQRLRLTIKKMRDGDQRHELLLIRRVVEVLGPDDEALIDQFGRPVTSCVIADDLSGKTSAQHEAEAKGAKLAQIKARILEAIRTAKEPIRRQDALRALAQVHAADAREAIAVLLAEGRISGGYGRPFVCLDGKP